MIELGVNIDHVATVRQARRTYEPDPVVAAALAEQGGADGITFHLREDRRHIQDRDVELLVQTVTVRTNFELACADDVLAIALRVKPDWALLVPESREEVTTEGGLNVAGDDGRIAAAVKRLKGEGILTSLFVDPDPKQVAASAKLGVDAVELHTGPYAHAGRDNVAAEIERLRDAGRVATSEGIRLHAGHGLNYANVRPIAKLENVIELNIGHAIISRAVMVGMREAVAEMRRILDLVSS
ncbi:pyridoxine 5'-phosphate synthase [Roseiconus lacunae]|uniref:Pyridoxine 5'-phosphate synthase n=1 Tax=Roseiconus lacunae TaxID=2605694 RepID=A0ABT7PJG0_9BACT|nr:pyridoxine 5'-phosphate synthase [Roseiconus lacunae]MCD0461712.1 pyridoxine 5'-phosphate synthase [Roseiconus lacunae]MDM4016641.1 pyridoxine 5'-phosphate synthase [Roseiconus lacunae]WRQ49509.1 pyridoxine 5'-phosphate synthase [Stieleria sp. HD01]